MGSVPGGLDHFAGQTIGFATRHAGPDPVDGRSLRVQDERVDLPHLCRRLSIRDRPGNVADVAIGDGSEVEQDDVSAAELPWAGPRVR